MELVRSAWPVPVLALLGWPSGRAVRALLARVPRGVDCSGRWCGWGTAALWSLTGVLAVTGVLPWRWVPVALGLALFAVPLVLADVRARRLPDPLTLAAHPVLGATAVFAEPQAWQRIAAAGLVLGGTHLLVHRLAPHALGGGDAKLAGALGMPLGAHGWFPVLVFAPLAAVLSLGLALGTRSRTVPHGPAMLASGWLLVVL
ncbi:prepilin peptidase [Sciscionella sediminilitoris]|uniref:prepilin peptidase n=1 Tax=Sciscionella sediminilitoris TaxID=1445613 RepID=UPI00068FD737|nr:A24 family peptidase [Sciscionella sp. SE31]